ncbi:MAG TPA: hypothetical protein VIX85_13030 [Acidimicrobiales bacterium]
MRDRNTKAGSVATEPLGGHGAPPVYRSGRVCANEGCGARLSIYNGAECCALHDMSAMASRPPRGTARRRRDAGRFRSRAA